MAKMTIYVPDDLRRRMDEAECENWSPLACKAFESRLAELITQRGVKDMRDVVMRLRASKMKAASWLRTEGRTVGVEWAKSKAEADELERLSAIFESGELDLIINPGPDEGYGGDEQLFFNVRPESKGERQEAKDFYDALGVGHKRVDPEWLIGFAEGAIGIWEQVEPHLGVVGGPNVFEHIEPRDLSFDPSPEQQVMIGRRHQELALMLAEGGMKIFDQRKTVARIKAIGRELHEAGGLPMMMAVYKKFVPPHEKDTKSVGRTLECTWSGIGEWEG